MKTVNAIWEKRNLGIDVYETTVEAGDDKDSLLSELHNVPTSAMHVMNLPVSRMDLYAVMTNRGFMYAETKLGAKATVKQLKHVPQSFLNLYSDYELRNVDSEDGVAKVLHEVSKGIFSTDRIALDPYFGVEIANKRYQNWICDEYAQKKSALTMITQKSTGEAIGFHLIRYPNQSGICQGLISGLYTGIQGEGLGIVMSLSAIHELEDLGGRLLVSKVSCNNLPVIRCHLAIGDTITGSEVVFVRHPESLVEKRYRQ